MGLMEFLSLVCPPFPVLYACEVVKRPDGRGYIKHHKADSIESLAKICQSLDASGSEVYFALGTFTQPERRDDGKWTYRSKTQVKALQSLWLDIDVGDGKDYKTPDEALRALKEFLQTTKMPTPLVVFSGGGLHVYWPLEKPVDPASWRKVALKLKAACVETGLKADPARTADEASILRPVSTHNYKYNPPVEVRTIFYKGNKSWLKQLHEILEPYTATETKSDIPANISQLGILDTYYIENVADECAVVRKMRDTRGDVPEPVWRGVLGLMKHTVDGERFIHSWSDGYAGYSYAETQSKYDRYKAGPTTCEYFRAYNDECKTCPHAGRVTTPLLLGAPKSKIEVPVESVTKKDDTTENRIYVENVALADYSIMKDPHEEVVKLPQGYGLLGNKIARVMTDESGEKKLVPFCNFTWFPYARVVDEDGQFVYKCKVVKGDTVEEFELPAKNVSSMSSLVETLGGVEVFPEGNTNKSRQMLAQYAAEYCSKLVHDVRPIHTYSQFGWTDDRRGFVYGRNLIEASHIHRAVLGGNAKRKVSAFSGLSDNPTPWCQAVEFMYNREDAQCMQYALLSGFGSLLGPFVGGDSYAGIPCAITSSASGIGKTTVAKLAISAFADWREAFLSSTSGATRQGRISTISTFGNLPVLLDELTDIDPHEFAELLYSVSNGRERQRLDSSGALREVNSWNSSVYITANENLVAKLSAMKVDTEANQVRVFEIDPSEYYKPDLDPVLVDKYVDAALNNKGAVGFVYIRKLVNDANSLTELLSKVTDKLVEMAPDLKQPKLRFYRYHATCTIAAGVILKQLGFISFDLNKLMHWTAKHVRKLATSVDSNSVYKRDSSDLLDELFRDLQGDSNMLVTKGYGVDRRESVPVIQQPRNKIEARYSLFDKGESPYEGVLLVASSYLKQWCAQRRISVAEFVKRQPSSIVVKPRSPIKLTAHTPIPSTSTRCIGFKIDMQEDDLDVEKQISTD